MQLKPCPFCGGEAEIEQYGDRRKSTIYKCTECSCRLGTGEERDHGARWNERFEVKDKPEEVKSEPEPMDWAVAVMLSKTNGLQSITTCFMGTRYNMTQDAAVGAVVEMAFKEKPGFSIDQILKLPIQPRIIKE